MTSIGSRSAAASPIRRWPADRFELWPIERPTPYANNPRLHSAVDIERDRRLHPDMGCTNPILVDEQGVLIAGHGRVPPRRNWAWCIRQPATVTNCDWRGEM